MALRALLIGCGSIGGLADLQSDRVLSWAKALSQRPDFTLDVHDADPHQASMVAARYGYEVFECMPWSVMSEYDVVIIATPTPTHAEFLARLLQEGPELIVCEKPVASTLAELDALEKIYIGQTRRRVLVNFHRRFQPTMARLRQSIADVMRDETCTNIVVTYQRGLHNNGSHAMDLLQFLFDVELDFEGATVFAAEHDAFADDPTMSLTSRLGQATVLWNGLRQVRASVFDIDLYFERQSIHLSQGGNAILTTIAPLVPRPPYPMAIEQKREQDAMPDPMSHVVAHVRQLLDDPMAPDNFLDSIKVSRRIIELEKAF